MALAGVGLGRSHQRAGGLGDCRAQPSFVWVLAARSRWALPRCSPGSWCGLGRAGGPSLVRARAVGGRSALLGQLFRLPQPPALHRGGEQPRRTLVVLRPGNGDREFAVYAIAAAGRCQPAAGLLVAAAVETGAELAALCPGLAAVCGAVFLDFSHQAAQLHAPCPASSGPLDCPGRCPQPVAHQGPLGLGADGRGDGGRVLDRSAAGGSDRFTGDPWPGPGPGGLGGVGDQWRAVCPGGDRRYCVAVARRRALARQLALGFATSLGRLAGAGLGAHR